MVWSSVVFNVWNMELLIMKGKTKNSFLIKIVLLNKRDDNTIKMNCSQWVVYTLKSAKYFAIQYFEILCRHIIC